jgi:hypothetical protein
MAPLLARAAHRVSAIRRGVQSSTWLQHVTELAIGGWPVWHVVEQVICDDHIKTAGVPVTGHHPVLLTRADFHIEVEHTTGLQQGLDIVYECLEFASTQVVQAAAGKHAIEGLTKGGRAPEVELFVAPARIELARLFQHPVGQVERSHVEPQRGQIA